MAETAKDEIVITPAMIEAGVAVLSDFRGSSSASLAKWVFEAMQEASESSTCREERLSGLR